MKTDVISSSPAAVLPGNRESNLVKIAEAVHRAMGLIRRSETPVQTTRAPRCCRASVRSRPAPVHAATRTR